MFKLTFQKNAHRVFQSSENLETISLRVLGNEIFEDECFKSEDLTKFFQIIQEEAPAVYENYLKHGPFPYGPRPQAILGNEKAIFTESETSFGLL